MAEPARMINKLGLAEVITNPFDPQGKLKESWTDFSLDSDGRPRCVKFLDKVIGTPDKPKVDAIVIQRYDHVVPFSILLAIKDAYKIPVLQENDDYLWDIPEMNPGVMSYHEKKPENQISPQDAMFLSRKSLGVYDGYIVSTDFLKDLYQNYSPAYTCPNSIDLSQRKFTKGKPHKEIRIGFSASAGHIQNLEMLTPIMEEVMRRHQEVVFYTYKHMPLPDFTDKSLLKRVRTMEWKPIHKYPAYLASLDFDIALAPLIDRLFNRAKSNLRLLEYWSSGHYPVIASDVGEYSKTIKHGVNGLLAKEADDWLNNIELLIKKPELRKKLGEAGYKTVEKDFNLEKNARIWVKSIQSAISTYSPDRTPPSQYLAPDFREWYRECWPTVSARADVIWIPRITEECLLFRTFWYR